VELVVSNLRNTYYMDTLAMSLMPISGSHHAAELHRTLLSASETTTPREIIPGALACGGSRSGRYQPGLAPTP
jgi:hypothetical protein